MTYTFKLHEDVTWWDGKPPRQEKGAANNLLLVTAQPEALAAFEGAL